MPQSVGATLGAQLRRRRHGRQTDRRRAGAGGGRRRQRMTRGMTTSAIGIGSNSAAAATVVFEASRPVERAAQKRESRRSARSAAEGDHPFASAAPRSSAARRRGRQGMTATTTAHRARTASASAGLDAPTYAAGLGRHLAALPATAHLEDGLLDLRAHARRSPPACA